MTGLGHLRPIDLPPEFAAWPLRPESGQTGRRLTKSALCQKSDSRTATRRILLDRFIDAAVVSSVPRNVVRGVVEMASAGEMVLSNGPEIDLS